MNFKETVDYLSSAEQYGIIATDSLTIARAEYKMGELLYYDGMEQEALTLLKSAEENFSSRLVEKAFVQNRIAVCYLVLGDYENTELYLQQCLMLSQKSHLDKVRRKALNNYAVFYQLQGKYDQAIACLKQNASNSYLDEKNCYFSI